jgi:alpha-glucosidase (family GH31 glycosyl hydrolase)
LGALYPFARNHNAYGSLPQEPYALGEIVLKTATKAIKLRYSLLKYLYTFILISDYSHIWTPLFFMFPKDENTYADEIADTTFLLTDYILVAPILEEGKTSRSVYLPHYNWVDLFSGKKYLGNQTYVIQNDLTDIIPIFIAEGFSLLLQDAEKIRSTKDLTNKFSIYSAFAFA